MSYSTYCHFKKIRVVRWKVTCDHSDLLLLADLVWETGHSFCGWSSILSASFLQLKLFVAWEEGLWWVQGLDNDGLSQWEPEWGWGSRPMGKCLSSMHEVLGSIPSTKECCNLCPLPMWVIYVMCVTNTSSWWSASKLYILLHGTTINIWKKTITLFSSGTSSLDFQHRGSFCMKKSTYKVKTGSL